ncbi:MAG: hypothetical protein ABR573_11800 [Candidatus Dormibacteria bacterium]
MVPPAGGYAFIVLFAVGHEQAVEAALGSAVNRPVDTGVLVLTPEVRGIDFLKASGPRGEHLDSWWERHVPRDSLPVYLLLDDGGLEEWIPGTHGLWFIGVTDWSRGERLESLAEPVFTVPTGEPVRIAQQAMLTVASAASAVAIPGVEVPLPPPPPPPSQPISYDPDPQPPRPAPTRSTDKDSRRRPRWTPGTGIAPTFRLFRDTFMDNSLRVRARLTFPARPVSIPADLGARVNANRPIVAGFASRKGGVGKTTHAAAVAATVGEALDGLPDTAALVDGNITNPDSWALKPPPDAATVRVLVSRLTAGLDPPAEQYARTPRLAIYPESRTGEEVYTQAEIDVLAEYLRRRHSFIAVDLPNALPSLASGGPGAVAAAWLTHCDAVVLPVNADPRARQGLLEYVAAIQDDVAFASIPILAPCILSSNRAISTDPAVQADLASLRHLGVEVIEVPDDQNALLALLRDLPINQASQGLRRAYLELTENLVSAVVRARSAR